MTTLTDKELIKEIKERISSLDVRDNIERRSYEIALASLEAEPIAYIFKHPAGKLFWALTDESNKEQVDVIPVYAAALASVVPDNASEPLAYAYKELTPEIMRNHLAVFERYGIAPNDSSTTIQALRIALDGIERSDAMLHGAKPVSQTYKLNKLSGNYPVIPDSWISCSERMPDTKTAVLVAREFDRKGDWRMKWATYIPGHPDANDGWIIPGASWKPSHWMPLPEPPQEAK
ncbi:DUF551 domain-containing protein [Escherichia coli]|uniref:DUF551 domain-containing protein n=2 Tax=Escherichia coli TaxID=562 RepID=UPI000DA5DD86|nr:DUF551 domain-containing protein [Escherichia coli]SQQ38608.1 bacteriophage protein [Escherichia coli]